MECPIDPEDCNVPNAALRESEARFRNTFENAAVGMAHVLTEGRWLRVNQKVADILGYEPDELLETTFQVLTHPDDLDLDLGLLQQVVRGERDNYRIEKRYFRKSGETIWANLTVGCVRNESGGVEYFISVIEDITEQKRMHQALFESEARFRAFQQTTPDGFMILRSLRGPEGKIRDFVWDYANPAAERLSLRAAGYLPGKRLLEEMPSHARSGLLDAYKTVVETGSSWQGEQMFTREAGDVWVSITATRLGDGFAATLRDVTTRKKAEADQEMLLRELNHRVKNSLATVQAIASHTLRDARDLETFRESFMGRLRAIAACHDLLVATARDEANIFQLVRDQVTPYSPPGSDRVRKTLIRRARSWRLNRRRSHSLSNASPTRC